MEVSNYSWTRLSTSKVICNVPLDPSVAVEWETEKSTLLVTCNISDCAVLDMSLGWVNATRILRKLIFPLSR